MIDRFDKSALKSLTFYQYCAFIFSFSGAIIQSGYIMAKYFNYPTISTIHIERPRESELPSISLCFFYRIPELLNYTIIDGIEHYPLTLHQIDSKLPKLHEWIVECKVLNATSYRMEACLEYYNHIVEYLSIHQKCYSFFESLPEQIWYIDNLVVGKYLVDITFNNSVINTQHIGIFITHTYSELEDSLANPSFLQFNTSDFNQAVVTYKRTAIRSLEAPYTSNCFRYTSLKCKHRRTCIRNCINEKLYNNYKSWFTQTYVKLSNKFKDGHFSKRPELDEHDECLEEYPHAPCNDYHYHAVTTSTFKSRIVKEDQFRLAVAYPTISKIEVKLKPKMKLLDQLCFLGGIVYLWTGISLLGTSTIVCKKCRSFVNYVHKLYTSRSDSAKKAPNNLSQIKPTISLIATNNGDSNAKKDDSSIRQFRLNQFTSHRIVSPTSKKSFNYDLRQKMY